MLGLIEILESAQYGMLLTEAARTDFLIKTYGERLTAKYDADRGHTPAAVANEISNEPGDTDGIKVLAYILSHDPTRNQAYTQWMCNKYLKNGLKLEDLPRVTQYLTLFDEAKRQLPQKDINGYKDVQALFTAVEPYLQHGSVAATQNDREARRNRQDDQAVVLIKNDQYELIKILTKEAACYYGRNTEWCTAWGDPKGRHPTRGNHYDSYAPRGPLYVILSADGTKPLYQWHFPSEQFLDVNDHKMQNPTFIEFVRQHPEVIKAIGEENFVNVAAQIGMQFFSPKMQSQIDFKKLAPKIDSLEALQGLPPEYQQDQGFLAQIAIHEYDRLEWLPNLKPETYQTIVQQKPHAFRYVPKEMRTPALAETAAMQMGYSDIARYIPREDWTPAIYQRHYDGASTNTGYNLSQVPEEYRSDTVYANIARNKAEIARVIPAERWTQELADTIAKANLKAAQYFPEQFLSTEILNAVYDRYKDGYDKEAYAVFGKVPLDRLSPEMVKWLIEQGKVPFKNLPDSLKTDADVIGTLLRKSPREIKVIPPELLTVPILQKYLTEHPEMVGAVPPELVTNEVIVPLLDERYFYDREHLLDKMPKSLMTPEMMKGFIAHNLIPVKRMPPAMRTPEAVIERVTSGGSEHFRPRYSGKEHHLDELKDVPPQMWTPQFALELIKRDHWAIDRVPEQLLDAPLLHAYLERHAATIHGHSPGDTRKEKLARGEADHKRFDPNLHTPESIIHAIKGDVIPAEIKAIPQKLLTPAVAATVLIDNPEQYAALPDNYKTDNAVLVPAVARNVRLLEQIPPEAVTEEVAYSAVKHWAHTTYMRKELSVLDRTHWPEETWQQAVGYIATLKDVPQQFRTPLMVSVALQRDPDNLRFLKDPSGYLKKNDIKPPENKDVISKWEDNGVVIRKGAMENASSLPQQQIDGGSYAEVKMGPSNKKVFVFDAKGKCVARLVTKDSKVTLPMGKDAAEPAKKLIIQAANAALSGFHAGDLEGIGIFDGGRRGSASFMTHDEAPRRKVGDLEWGETTKAKGGQYTAFVGDTPIVEIQTGETTGAWGRRGGRSTLDSIKLIDKKQAFEHRVAIFQFIESLRIDQGGYHDLPKIGALDLGRGHGFQMVAVNKLGQIGKYAGYTNKDGSILSVCDEDGIVVYAHRRKTGSLNKVNYPYRDYGSYSDGASDKERDAKNEADTALHRFANGGGAPALAAPKKDEKGETPKRAAEPAGDLFSQPAQAAAPAPRPAPARRQPPQQLDLFGDR